MTEYISIDDFKKIDIRIGTVITAEHIPDTDKLLRLTVDLGEEEHRQIVSGIAEYVSPEDLEGKQCAFAANLEPRTIRGFESRGMILAVLTDDEKFAYLTPSAPLPAGSVVT